MGAPLLPMAAGWGVSPWSGPSPAAGPILPPAAPGFLPGLKVTARLSPEAMRWVENYRARLASRDWREEIRPRILARARSKCERCGAGAEVLEIHHLHYRSLWSEGDADLEALCPACHDWADEQRRASMAWAAEDSLAMAQFRGFCFRAFGDCRPSADAWERFERWLDEKEERERWE